MEQFEIEPMSIDDYDKVLPLWSETEGVVVSKADSCEAIGQFLERNPDLSFVARFNKKIIGVILCGHDGRRGHVYHLAVDESYRRQGIAKALVDRCLQKLKNTRISACRAVTLADNSDGQEFWKAVGWSERDQLRVFRGITDKDN